MIGPDALLCGFDARLDLGLRVVDVPLRVRTNDQEIWERLAAYFDPYRADVGTPPVAEVRLIQGAVAMTGDFEDVRRGTGKKIKEAVREIPGGRLILKRSTGAIMGLWPGQAVAIGDLRANLNQGINLINACYAKALVAQGHVLFHASAVSWAGRAAALAGPPGAGKSTAALHLVEEGFRLLSNDRVLARAVRDDVEAFGYPKQPRVNPGTLLHHPRLSALLRPDDRVALGALTRTELWGLERKSDVDLDSIYGRGTVELRAALRALILLKWRPHERGIETRRLTPTEAMANLPLFQKDLGVFDLDRPLRRQDAVEHLSRYAAVLDRVQILEVTGGVDFSALVDLVGDLLAK